MHNFVELLEESFALLHFCMTNLDGSSKKGCSSERKDLDFEHTSLLPIEFQWEQTRYILEVNDLHFHKSSK